MADNSTCAAAAALAMEDETKPQLSKCLADVADETEEAEASSTSSMDSLAMDESKSVYKTLSDPDDASIEAVTSGDTLYKSAKRFEDLNLTPELLKGLYVEMKFERLSKIQGICLPMILTPPNKNLIAQAHNGSGKTTCFVLGMLSRVDPKLAAPQALCICPTRERAIQNIEVMLKMGKYTGITSELAIPADPANYIPINKRPPVTAQVIIGTPGTIHKWVVAKKLGTSCMKILVFDEADNMLAESGFQDDSIKIMKAIVRGKANCQVLLFSATLNGTVEGFVPKIVKDLFVKDYNHLVVKKEELSLESVKQNKGQCPDELSEVMVIKDKILELARKVSTIQGALKQEDRDKIINELKEDLTQVLISTDLLARGCDQSHVNLVNCDLPVQYGHWTGRAGPFGCKDMAESHESRADLVRRLNGRDAAKRQMMGESSLAPPATQVPSLRNQDTSSSLTLSTTHSVDPMIYAPVPPMREALVRYVANDEVLGFIQARLAIEMRARLEVESKLKELKVKLMDLEDKCAWLVAWRVRKQKAHKEALTTMLSRYRSSKAFREDVKTYITKHVNEVFENLMSITAGRELVTMEGMMMHDVGEYTMQQRIYSVLRQRDETFDPKAWGLPAEFANPEFPIELIDAIDARTCSTSPCTRPPVILSSQTCFATFNTAPESTPLD
ncbi:PREDICTED: DEAD-box ATP-dependent RNA helicase 38-like [Ipomoea nil]|uniref:DEAD-box ATP-dependent RNA helicase 38-like n=1 Tax=Ipomoea nil TaxID=35883 RepID=UPI0009012AD0|nr:PREDICTED: DEAD-box ATP-dependent RNA helicase 38-like [Ipomoea nil]